LVFNEMTGIGMATTNFEKLRVYRLAEEVADRVWGLVVEWDRFAKDTVGQQLVRAADSIGANIAEGTGRGPTRDNQRFVKIARGSLYETKHWLRRATHRGLLTPDQAEPLLHLLDELAPRLNAYLTALGKPSTTKRPHQKRTRPTHSEPTG
jgi:four helix bundle protein